MKRLHLSNFRNRLIIFFVILIIIPITTVAFFSFIRQNKFLVNDTTMYLQQSVDQITKLLEEKLVEVDKRTWPLFSNDALNVFSAPLDNLSYDYYKRFFSFKKDILLSVIGDRTDVQSVNFIANNGNLFSSKDMYIKPENVSKELEEKIVSKLDKRPLRMIWMGEDRPFILDYETFGLKTGQKDTIPVSSYQNIMAVKKIISTKTGDKLGTIIINFKEGFLTNILGTSISGIKARIFVIDEENRYLLTDSPNMIFKNCEPELIKLISGSSSGHGNVNLFGHKYLGVYNTSINSGWKILVLVTEDDLLEKNKGLFKYTIIVIAFACIAFIFIATLMALWISKPITELTSVMETVADGDLEVRIKFNAIDEFQILAKRFNKMMERIQELMEKNREIEKEKNLAEIKAMQMQVNPHFLYNTLNSIYSLSKQYGFKPIMEMTYSLSMLFRIIFSKTNELVTIRESIEQLEHYLTIQRIRFEDKFNVIYDIEEEVYNCKIPGLMIQMLVENSIVHGIEKKKGKGEVNIIGYMMNGIIKIIVKDDGVGMEEDRLEKIREVLADDKLENKEDMIALRNINRRLKLNYGDEFGLNIFSISGKGTTVEMLLPEIK